MRVKVVKCQKEGCDEEIFINLVIDYHLLYTDEKKSYYQFFVKCKKGHENKIRIKKDYTDFYKQ